MSPYSTLINCVIQWADSLRTQRDIAFSSRERVGTVVKSRHPNTVGELVRLAMAETALREEDLVAIVKEMVADGSLVVEGPTYEVESSWDYLLTPTLSMWFWTAMSATFLAVAAVLFTPDVFPLVTIRWLLGSILVLFLPGYALMQLLFPKASEMDSLERFALGIGLSLALVPLIGLVLNYTPWGIRFIPVTTAISAFTIIFVMAAAARKYLYIREQGPKAGRGY